VFAAGIYEPLAVAAICANGGLWLFDLTGEIRCQVDRFPRCRLGFFVITTVATVVITTMIVVITKIMIVTTVVITKIMLTEITTVIVVLIVQVQIHDSSAVHFVLTGLGYLFTENRIVVIHAVTHRDHHRQQRLLLSPAGASEVRPWFRDPTVRTR
jgi:hypothetical protein